MPINFKKFFQGLKIVPKSGLTSDAKGELEVDDSNSKLHYHNGTSASAVVTEDHSATLENKTIDGDDNTLLNLGLSTLKTELADADTFLVRDASGVVVSGTKAVPTGDVVGTDDAQTLENKDIDADLNTITNIDNDEIKAGAGIEVSKLEALTPDTVIQTDSNGFLESSTIYSTELSHLSGISSNIQDQLDDKLDLAGGTMSGDIDMDSNLINNLGDPVLGTDAANKQYVDSVAQGLNIKASVKAATTSPGTLATSFENGDTIDGVTLVTGDRILIKNQTTQSENGIYVVQASGAPLRSSDASTFSQLVSAFTFVQQGTVNADTGWVCTSNSGTIDIDPVVFVQFSAAGVITVDGQGIELTGTQLSLELDGSTLSKSSSGLKVATGGITNDEISNSANIARSKFASGTNNHVLINDGSGVMSSEARLALVRGGSSIDNTQTNDSTTTGANAQLNAVTGHVRLTDNTLTSLTMIPAPASGGVKFSLYNDTGNAITIINEAGATAANRIITGQGTDITMGIGMSLDFVYDSGSSRWLVIGGVGSSTSSGSGFIKVKGLDISNTTLPTGAVVIDGLTILDGDKVLFTELSSGNNRIYEANESGGSVTSWTALSLYDGASTDPTDGDTVFIQEGDLYADNILLFDGTEFGNLLNQKAELTLLDNMTDEIFLELDTADFKFIMMEYSIERDTDMRTGIFSACSNGSTSDDNDLPIASIGDVGVVIDSTMDGSILKLKYTTTNTGDDAILKRTLRIW